jgi:sugar/nucleoside kinase (ribokinase family)
VSVSDLCEEYGLQPTVFYRWQKAFFENGAQAFTKNRDGQTKKLQGRIGELEAKLAKKNEVLGEVMEAVAEKVGSQGARIHVATGEVIEVPGFPVEIYNILGAGDAFGGGFIYGYVNGWDWYKSARLGNACGAIVVTKHGCANFMPTMPEIDVFVQAYGGLD